MASMRDIKPLSERREETRNILFLSGTVAVVFSGILLAHVMYARQFGGAVNKAELVGAIVFFLFGLALLYSGYEEAKVLSGPRVAVRVTPAEPRAGNEFRLDWTITGRAARLQSARLEFQGEESVVTDYAERGIALRNEAPNKVVRTVFASHFLVELTAPVKPTGHVRFRVPPDARPSSVSPERTVDWGIHVACERTDGERFEDNYPVTIREPIAS